MLTISPDRLIRKVGNIVTYEKYGTLNDTIPIEASTCINDSKLN